MSTEAEAPAYTPKPGTLGTKRAQWALRVCDRVLKDPECVGLAAFTMVRGLRRDISRFKGGTYITTPKWRWLVQIAADLGMAEYDDGRRG